MKGLFYSSWLILLGLLAGCIDPYMPDVISSPQSYLVVDGFLNSNGVTQIKLSRTYGLSGGTAAPKETRATLYIEEETGTRYQLRESSATPGTYLSDALVLNPAVRHRLSFSTATGQTYASDYVTVKITPPIDSVTFRPEADELKILVNTHDDRDASQYYRWEYEETWETRPLLTPELEYNKITDRLEPITVYFPLVCWSNEKSANVNLSKTTNLNQDVVSNYVLRTLPAIADRLYLKYSILVHQYALTREEYQYWELLRKNTESIGTLFDPLPSQLSGNLHNVSDSNELVIGYLGAHSMTEKRIFIRRAQLPAEWRIQSGYDDCIPPNILYFTAIRNLNNIFGTYSIIPLYQVPEGYAITSKECVDCRLRGTDVRPAFWQ
ncbi:DUF4249 domain-containing protein [Hymenobacter sp. ASUV-10]|uniref:DUF4249 domain-containing protein n=1 Tax=Hymenobacter aranciens TaxID=3063996 RepID=A0ABT9BA06_9BACT|nr:DUF4249 domain-containing protein [Hymenobacter sp. ASUV-10]MDO7875099.1 DUF4249 domain-containing protein [Hymenobacter sp. ASUV-10]